MSEKTLFPGAAFLIKNQELSSFFTPDEIDHEHRMISDTTRSFVEEHVQPNMEKIEKGDYALMRDILSKAGEMGLLSAEIPEEYGGLELDLLSVMLIGEQIGYNCSLSVSFGAHTGIGTYPILYFGTHEQKAKYLPKFATAEWVSCYALTEPEAGSDALSAATKAVLNEEKTHYTLNGSKMWITNGGFADVAMVFAKVDGEKFTCFVVPTDTEGFEVGADEKKLGLRGSSTTAMTLDNVKVPVDSVVGEIGKGHKIALNVLNVGRFKLASWATAFGKFAMKDAFNYAQERKQFGAFLYQLGAIQEKIAKMVAKTWAGESIVYRTAGMIKDRLSSLDSKDPAAYLKGIEEHVIECAIIKVDCSEILDYIVDETVQIYGGYGYSAEYPAERHYRDSRINRIFEGTNEINRLTIAGMLLKKLAKSQLAIHPPEKLEIPEKSELQDAINKFNLARLLAFSNIATFAQKYGADQPDSRHQNVTLRIADLMIAIYRMDSAIARCRKFEESSHAQLQLAVSATKLVVEESCEEIMMVTRQLQAEERMQDDKTQALLGQLFALPSTSLVKHFQLLSASAIEKKGYPLG